MLTTNWEAVAEVPLPFQIVLAAMRLRNELDDLAKFAMQFWLAVIWSCLTACLIATAAAEPDTRATTHLSAGHELEALKLVSARRRRRSEKKKSPQRETVAASYARFSSDKQSDTSITDQRRKCNEAAAGNEHEIRPEREYSDEAVSGTKLRREGLDQLLRDAEAGEFNVLYFHSLSRLARESVITMPLLKKLVHVCNVRIISVTEGIDSDRDGWEVIATIMALLHERYIKELGENVFRGQEGAVLAGVCVGDYRFGYTSAPILGSEASRKGRNPKPRKTYIIDEIAAPWVIRIYFWFVVEGRSLNWITRQLNARRAPKDHRSTTKDWHHHQVAGVLSSEKYIGIWPWGEMQNVRDPLTGLVHQELRAEEESGKWTRHFPHLRLIDDATFNKAQAKLEANEDKYASNRDEKGQLNGSTRANGAACPTHLLASLIVCKECEHVFWAEKNYLFCQRHRRGTCPCKTKLRRDRAERLILKAVSEKLTANPAWPETVFQFLQVAWQRIQENIPAQLAAKEQQLAGKMLAIKRLLDSIEEGKNDATTMERIEQRRKECEELECECNVLRRRLSQVDVPPSQQWVRQRLSELHTVLTNCTPAACHALRDLVGGQIVVEEIVPNGKGRRFHRGYLQIRTSTLARVVGEMSTEVNVDDSSQDDTITIDFVEDDRLAERSAKAKDLYDQGLLNVKIAKIMKCSKSQITKLLKHWFHSRGLQMPDGRSRRGELAVQHQAPPPYQEKSEEAFRLYSDKMEIQAIADALGWDRNTVTDAIRFAHEKRGLTMIDGRTRRKLLRLENSNQPAPSSGPGTSP